MGLQVRAGMHTISDFPSILADAFNKRLRREYDELTPTWAPIVRITTVADFKTINRLQLGDAPELQEVDEHGEFTRGTISEGKETYKVNTWGRIFAITRQAIINDDTDAFMRVPMMFGRAARHLESELVWGEITTNGNMGDGTALFHADHGNLASASGIAVNSLGAGRSLMRRQKGLDYQHLNLRPMHIIVPAALETKADQIVTPLINPQNTSSTNPFAGKMDVIAEPRLDDTSETAWYLSADVGQIDIIEIAMLEGEGGPTTETEIGFEVDGMRIKARHDIGVKVLDWRGLFRNGA